MRGVHLFMFIVALPALAAIGFDLYLFGQAQAEDPSAEFMMTTPGYILTHFHMDTYKWLVENTGEHWPTVDSILAHKTFYVGLAFAGIWYALLLVLKILRVYPFRGNTGTVHASNTRTSELLGVKSKKMKYKRK
jgi:hypothetical protein